MQAYLILSIVLTTLFASCYKIAARLNCNLDAVNLWMYVGSTASIVAVIISKHHLSAGTHALYLGTAAGVMLYVSTLAFFRHMKFGQLSVSWTVISLAVAFPVVASIFLWHEIPSAKQVAGLVLIVIALLLFGRNESRSEVAE
jgi:drug/metabolite transporter (DMT)-like permease